MKPLTNQEMSDIIQQVKADVTAKSSAQKFYDAVYKVVEEQVDNGISIDDPRIDDVLKSYIGNQAAVIKSK